jgi:hypothetical protein
MPVAERPESMRTGALGLMLKPEAEETRRARDSFILLI